MDRLIVIDVQNDFISGSLGTPEAERIVPCIRKKIESFNGEVIFTRDTHTKDYLDTKEGMELPIIHCMKGCSGWEIADELKEFVKEEPMDKPCFGNIELAKRLESENKIETIEGITLVGLCTDICIIANAFLLQAFLPETQIIVDASCCAGVTPDSHTIALKAMSACQIKIVGEEF